MKRRIKEIWSNDSDMNISTELNTGEILSIHYIDRDCYNKDKVKLGKKDYSFMRKRIKQVK